MDFKIGNVVVHNGSCKTYRICRIHFMPDSNWYDLERINRDCEIRRITCILPDEIRLANNKEKIEFLLLGCRA